MCLVVDQGEELLCSSEDCTSVFPVCVTETTERYHTGRKAQIQELCCDDLL